MSHQGILSFSLSLFFSFSLSLSLFSLFLSFSAPGVAFLLCVSHFPTSDFFFGIRGGGRFGSEDNFSSKEIRGAETETEIDEMEEDGSGGGPAAAAIWFAMMTSSSLSGRRISKSPMASCWSLEELSWERAEGTEGEEEGEEESAALVAESKSSESESHSKKKEGERGNGGEKVRQRHRRTQRDGEKQRKRDAVVKERRKKGRTRETRRELLPYLRSIPSKFA
jgi:hypothetical protein